MKYVTSSRTIQRINEYSKLVESRDGVLVVKRNKRIQYMLFRLRMRLEESIDWIKLNLLGEE